MNARLHATSPSATPTWSVPTSPLHARLPRVSTTTASTASLNIAAGDGAYTTTPPATATSRRGGRHVVHQHRPGARGNGSHRGRADPPAGYSNPFCDMANPRAIELCRKLAELAPRRPRPRIPTTGGSTAVDTPRSASCTTTRTAAASAPRSTSSRGSTPTTARPSSACRWAA
ncbi:hypothetical protein ACPA9J_04140 [Pseudomonas aeruginosa]